MTAKNMNKREREREERKRGGEGAVPLVTHASMNELYHGGSESSFAIAAARTKTLRAGSIMLSRRCFAFSCVSRERERTHEETQRWYSGRALKENTEHL